MSRRQATRKAADNLLTVGAAIHDDLPPLAARFSSTYGAEVNYAIYNPMKGRRRDLTTAISAALRHQEVSEEKIEEELMEQFMQETPTARKNRRDAGRLKELDPASPAADDESDIIPVLPTIHRRERAMPISRAPLQDEGQDDISKVSDHDDQGFEFDAEQAASELYSSSLRTPTPEGQQRAELALKAASLAFADDKHPSDQSDFSSRTNFNTEGGLYGEATFKRLMRKAFASVADCFYKGSLTLIVIAFWAVLVLWFSQHYTINPAIKEWDFAWDSSAGMWENMAQFTPVVPILAPESLYFGNNSSDSPVLQQLIKEVERQKKALKVLQNSASLSKEARERLNKILPDLVVVGKDGRLPNNIYYAIRDDLRREGVFFNMGQNYGGKFEISSHAQWDAILRRIEKDGYAKTTDILPADAYVTNKEWQDFLATNSKDIENLRKSMTPGTTKMPLNVIKREDVIEMMEVEFASQKKMMKEEMGSVEKRLEEKLMTAVKAAAISSAADKMTRGEVAALVSSMLRQAIREGQLDTLASGKISYDWRWHVKNSVNFFARGNGAVIDPHRTSPSHEFDPKNPKNPSVTSMEPGTILDDWSDVGQCWCGTIGRGRATGLREGTTVSVLMGTYILPKTVVVEHIEKGATMEDDARPRDIEVWAMIEDVGIRERVQSFAAAEFGVSRDADGKLIGELDRNDGFAKIGRFTFPETRDAEVYVYSLSPELANMGVETSHIRIVATTNYGNKDKTCFYRVRVMGDRIDELK